MGATGDVFATLAERDSVLHSWWIQSSWNAPTVVGGKGHCCTWPTAARSSI